MNPEHPWMWWPWGMWIFPVVMFVIMLICFFLFSRFGGFRPPWWGRPGGHYNERGDSETALEILKKRYVRGEITKEEFDRMKKDILS